MELTAKIELNPDILVLNIVLLFYRVHIVDAEGQHVSVIDGVYNRVCMKLVSEGLRGRQ